MSSPARMYNSPLEAGLRVLFLLRASGRTAIDAQRLLYFDYLCLHSGEAGGPDSLHPPAPSQAGEVLVRREVLGEGLALMVSRDLLERRYMATGIRYRITKAGLHVLDHFESSYADSLAKRCGWVVERFGSDTDASLERYMSIHVTNWQNELVREFSQVGSDGV